MLKYIIIEAIKQRQRLKVKYNDKQYLSVEFYSYGVNEKGVELCRVYDVLGDNCFKLFRFDRIQIVEVRKNDRFNILRPGYTPNQDKQIKNILECVK